MAYRLKGDVDLARHVRDAAYWHKPVGTLISGSHRASGSHLALSAETRWTVEEKSPEEIAGHVADLVSRAENATPGTTEYEHAWGKVATHLEVLAQHAKKAQKAHKAEDKALRLANAPKPVQVAGKYTSEAGKVLRDTELGHAVATAGIHVAGAAGGLLGVEESQHFMEALNKIAENPLAEAGIVAAVALIIHALVVAIRKALTKRRDAKIEAARTADAGSLA